MNKNMIEIFKNQLEDANILTENMSEQLGHSDMFNDILEKGYKQLFVCIEDNDELQIKSLSSKNLKKLDDNYRFIRYLMMPNTNKIPVYKWRTKGEQNDSNV